jgi:spermidine/putrescine transport system permease protein
MSRIPKGAAPYLLLLPGIGWLVLFYLYPAFQLFLVSLWTGNITDGYVQTWNFGIYAEGFNEYWPWIVRSAAYGGLATILTFLLGYPLAYTIAFRGGRYKNLLLFLVIAPFFTSFLLRTISWTIILSDNGIVLGPLKDVGVLPDEARVLQTPLAVIAGITYNLLPFMTLPLYVALEKVDVRLIEAARDLYAGPWRRGGAQVGGVAGAVLAVALLLGLGYATFDAEGGLTLITAGVLGAIAGGLVGSFLISEAFVRVIWPLSLPGVFAGSILVFIPTLGDYVNVELLGNPRTQMIGNVIQNRFLQQNDYPLAAALSFILMAAILVAIFLYARALGTEELTGGRA